MTQVIVLQQNENENVYKYLHITFNQKKGSQILLTIKCCAFDAVLSKRDGDVPRSVVVDTVTKTSESKNRCCMIFVSWIHDIRKIFVGEITRMDLAPLLSFLFL